MIPARIGSQRLKKKNLAIINKRPLIEYVTKYNIPIIIDTGKSSYDEIKRCEDDQSASLKLISSDLPEVSIKTKGPKYIPLSKRGDKPNAIAWIVKYHPELKDSQIVRLIGTTKNTIEKIRDRTHWNILNITAKHPVLLELCSYEDLNKAIVKSGGDPTSSEVQVNAISELP